MPANGGEIHGEALSVAMRVKNPDCAPVIAGGRDQPTPNPALMILLTMISQYFTGLDLTRFALRIATTR